MYVEYSIMESIHFNTTDIESVSFIKIDVDVLIELKRAAKKI